MVCKLSILCFSLVTILQLQLNNSVECRPFIIDDLMEYVKAQTRSHVNKEFHKYIMHLKITFKQGKTAHHLTAFDKLILTFYLCTKSENKRLDRNSNIWSH